jgi:tRNA-specific 2-thiouridylase
VPGGDYRDALRERAGWRPTPGPLLDSDGRQVGEHAGAASYTIGQRQGLGVALGEPRYVARIDAAANLVQLGRREDLARDAFVVRDASFTAGRAPRDAFDCEVRIRHRAAPAPARVERLTADRPGIRGTWRVQVRETVWAPAPGQAAVWYDGDEVIGGGRIASEVPSVESPAAHA